jgi:hypothetical protein
MWRLFEKKVVKSKVAELDWKEEWERLDYERRKEQDKHIFEIDKLKLEQEMEVKKLFLDLNHKDREKALDISTEVDKVRDMFKESIVKLSEAKSVAEAKYSEVKFRNISLEKDNSMLQDQIKTLVADMTEMAKRNNDIKIVEPKIIESKINILPLPAQTQIVK